MAADVVFERWDLGLCVQAKLMPACPQVVITNVSWTDREGAIDSPSQSKSLSLLAESTPFLENDDQINMQSSDGMRIPDASQAASAGTAQCSQCVTRITKSPSAVRCPDPAKPASPLDPATQQASPIATPSASTSRLHTLSSKEAPRAFGLASDANSLFPRSCLSSTVCGFVFEDTMLTPRNGRASPPSE